MNLAPTMAHGVVNVHDRLVFANSPLGVRTFIGWFWYNNGQERFLIEFLFARNGIEDQQFRASENMVTIAFHGVIVVFVLGGTSAGDFA
jgi:hypothetical protein